MLLRRLENQGIENQGTNLIDSYLSRRMQRVILNGIQSYWITSNKAQFHRMLF